MDKDGGPLSTLVHAPPDAINIARTSIVALMSKITIGRLRVLTREQIYEFGPGGGLGAELKVINDAFWVRLLLLGDLVRP